MLNYSIKQVSDTLLSDIKSALESIGSHGSVEIYVSNSTVTQITVRDIKKTQVNGKK